MNPLTDLLDMRGPEFLGVYAAMLLFGWIVVLYLRWETSCVEPDDYDGKVHPYEIAYLSGGPPAVVAAAVASLTRNGALERQVGHVQLQSKLPVDAHPVERAIETACAAGAEGRASLVEVRRAAVPVAGRVADRLAGERLVVGELSTWKMRSGVVAVVGVLMAIGMMKISIGSQRRRPVGLLTVMTFGNLLLVPAALGRLGPTSRGKKLLERLRDENEALKQTATSDEASLSGADLALAVGLFGAGVLATWPSLGSELGFHKNVANPSSGWSSCSSSSCSSSCGSSCGGGCGGGGCGGCGG